MSQISGLMNYAIIFIYLTLFATAAFDKIKTFETPEWFLKQFQTTFLGRSPGFIKMTYWGIAIAEVALSILFIAAAFVPSLLSVALLAAMFLFGVLCFGLRITYDFQGSANMFTYFTASLVSLFITMYR